MKKDGKAFRCTRETIVANYPIAFDNGATESPLLIRMREWCKINHYSIRQARNFIRKQQLLAFIKSHVIYVAPCKTIYRDKC